MRHWWKCFVMGCFCFVSFGRTVSSMLLQKKKLVTEVTWGWRNFKVISEEIVNEQKSLHFAMPFLSTQNGYDFVMSAMKHWLFAFWGGLLDSWISWHYCLDTHHSTCTAIFIRKKLKCYDMISVCHNHHSTTWIGWWFNVVINPEEWWIPVAWCLSCLTHSIAVTRWLQRPQKRDKKRMVESDDPVGVDRELTGFEVDERQVILDVFLVMEWIRIDEFHACSLWSQGMHLL